MESIQRRERAAANPAVDRREPPQHDERAPKTWLIPLGLLLAAAAFYALLPGFREAVDAAYAVLTSGDRARIERWVQGFGAWGPVTVLGMMIAQTVVPVIPSVLLMVVTVLAFGPLWGGVLTYAGLLVAASVAYGLGRALGPGLVQKLVGTKTEHKVHEFVCDYGVWGVIVARVSPVVSTDAVSFVAGLVAMRYLRFLFATAVGTLPLTVLVAWLGVSVERMTTGLAIVSVISLVAFFGYVAWDRRRKRTAAGQGN